MTARLRQAGVVRSWRLAYMGAIKLPSRAAIRLNRYPIQFSSRTEALVRFMECGIPHGWNMVICDERLNATGVSSGSAAVDADGNYLHNASNNKRLPYCKPGCGVAKNKSGRIGMSKATDGYDLTRVGPGTVMGEMMRQYWIPAALSSELKSDGDPMRLMLLGESADRVPRQLGPGRGARPSMPASLRFTVPRPERAQRYPLRLPRLEIRR